MLWNAELPIHLFRYMRLKIDFEKMQVPNRTRPMLDGAKVQTYFQRREKLL